MTSPEHRPSIEEQRIEAARRLAELKLEGKQAQAEVVETRATLAQLNLQVEAARHGLDDYDAALLLEANQHLLLSSLQAQSEADACADTLEDLSRSAQMDALTELPNRERLLDRFADAIAIARRKGNHLALLFIDMNNFKMINDTLGHTVGDQVLKRAAQCLSSVVREVDTVSRHGGDEFLILLTDIGSASDAVVVAHKVISALGMPFCIADHVLRLTASIGIGLYPQDGDTPQLLIDRADAAMYRAKRQGGCSVAFHEESAEQTALRPPGASVSLQSPVIHHDVVIADHARNTALLREANEHLVLAVLNAQVLQAAAEESQQRQKEFLALVAHELRNPLMPLGIAASMLRSSDASDLQRMKDIIETQVDHITRLIGDLLDLSRSNTGKLRLHFSNIDLVKVIDAAVNASRPSMDVRLQHFRLDISSQPIVLEADPIRLSQILSNLLDNASKYTPDGGEICLLTHVQANDLVIRVSDNGIGISPDALPRVFEPFAQDAHATGFNGQGLGIGLTVVKQLVEAHGGTVTVASSGIGLGSEFSVTLPLNVFREEDISN